MTSPEELAPVIPLFSVVRGTPAAEELAALVAVLVSRSGGGNDAPEPAAPSRWASPQGRLRKPLTPGPGAWAASAWH